MEIRIIGPVEAAKQVLAGAPGEWEMVPGGQDGALRYEVSADEKQLSAALGMLVQAGIPVVSYNEVPADLEDAFMSLTK